MLYRNGPQPFRLSKPASEGRGDSFAWVVGEHVYAAPFAWAAAHKPITHTNGAECIYAPLPLSGSERPMTQYCAEVWGLWTPALEQ